eukprot:1157212-Pelagomonas_calceolata.AAC.8
MRTYFYACTSLFFFPLLLVQSMKPMNKPFVSCLVVRSASPRAGRRSQGQPAGHKERCEKKYFKKPTPV